MNEASLQVRTRKRQSRGWLLGGGALVVVMLVFFFGADVLRGSGPEPGAIYVRPAVDSSAVASSVLEDTTAASTPMARRLIFHLLTHDLRVQVDHVGQCGDVFDRYMRYNEGLARTIADDLDREFRTVRPILLGERMMDRCFSYTVTYDVPLSSPMLKGGSLIEQVPVRLALIHPIADFQQFRRE